ncbi:MAG: 3-ketoacyl-ACP reductase [Sphingobacteriales bacterium SCN 48-20]|uniref:3-ketoacyl-ACP reductase n=1 Tax=Terrimonas ferruginea TaxID=249 RepID=UPI00086D8D83|nr:3-ketoacyl-ACP reductase [Terrimonas ferruginea]MBN8782032.1 3-ketoacyl-ACP reductase [Terrimonas ferruginea]ODT92374.1 MAG: 3-ketoacyl-ACP reductase [Sphingobacteriales bacterium SCN 48-20]OJW45164.1 MAG: 3-ketoacyl-ACP reductase [Sphingobacteriales bacterium 48-107]
MTDLKGKTALITGASRSLGKATAIALAKEGVNIAITGRDTKKLEETATELRALGVNVTYAAFDVANQEAVNAGIEKIAKQFPQIDILINNAGIAGLGSVEEMPTAKWEEIIQVNVLGVYYVAKAVIPLLKANGGGDIINVASTAGLKGSANYSAYSASKAAVMRFSESLMLEMRKENIRVVTLTPSTIATDMTITDLKITDGNPDKVLQPEDFAQLIVDILKFERRALIANASIFSSNP